MGREDDGVREPTAEERDLFERAWDYSHDAGGTDEPHEVQPEPTTGQDTSAIIASAFRGPWEELTGHDVWKRLSPTERSQFGDSEYWAVSRIQSFLGIGAEYGFYERVKFGGRRFRITEAGLKRGQRSLGER